MIALTHHDDITTLLLNRPEKRNAMTPPMLREFTRAVRELDDGHDAPGRNPRRALVIGGVGESFCAGFDLSLCRDDEHALADLLSSLYDAVAALRRAPCPVVIAVHGAAIAGGCALLGGADFVVTHTAAKLGYPVVRLGISPAVTAPFLRTSVGDAHTRAMLLEGALISGAAAAAIGLASDCVATPDDVMPRALHIARELAAKPPAALRATRAWLSELDGTLPPPPHPASSPPSNLTSSTTANLAHDTTRAGLETSLRLVANAESRERLAKLWEKR